MRRAACHGDMPTNLRAGVSDPRRPTLKGLEAA